MTSFEDFLEIINKKFKVKYDFTNLNNVYENLNNFFYKCELLDELNIKGKTINYVTDSEEVIDELHNIDTNILTICCNSSILFFNENNINIDYVFANFNHLCTKFYCSYYLENRQKLKNLKKIIQMNNRIHYNNSIKNLKIIEQNYENKELEKELKNTYIENYNDLNILTEKYENNIDNSNEITNKIIKSEFLNFEYFYEYDLSTGMLGLLYLIKLKCKINLYGFTFNLTNKRYHCSNVEKYLFELKHLNSKKSSDAWVHKQEGQSIEQFILFYLITFHNIKIPNYLNDIVFN